MKKNKLGKKKLVHIADRILNKPLYVEKRYAMTAINFFGGRSGFEFIVTQDSKIPIKQEIFDDIFDSQPSYELLENGTAVLPISGTLTHDGTGAHMMSSLGQGYNSITGMAKSIASNPEAKRVAMMIGSNGGEVSGCSSCAESLNKIFGDAGLPVWAFVDENAYSAAYWQAVSAERIVLPSSGGVGSVGTVMTHVSYEKQIEEAGAEITMIHAGDKKVIGNPYKNLSRDDYDHLNSEIQYYGGLFRQGVHDLRPGLSLSKLEDAQAGTFPGQEAVDQGFADEVMSKDDFFNAFAEVERNSTKTISIGTNEMDEKELKALKAKAARADQLETDLENEKQESKKKIEAAEKSAERFSEVLASEEAVGKREQALELLNDKDFSALSADKIKGLLKNMASSEEPEELEEVGEVEEEEEEEEELHNDAKALLKVAKKNNPTKRIESIGETNEGLPKTKNKDKGYSTQVEDDREAMLSSFIKSASIVKKNLARSTL